SYVCYLLRQGYVCSLHSFPTRRSSDLSKAWNSLENGSYPNDRFSIAAVARNNDSQRQGNCDTDCHRYKRKIDMFQKSADDHILAADESIQKTLHTDTPCSLNKAAFNRSRSVAYAIICSPSTIAR